MTQKTENLFFSQTKSILFAIQAVQERAYNLHRLYIIVQEPSPKYKKKSCSNSFQLLGSKEEDNQKAIRYVTLAK